MNKLVMIVLYTVSLEVMALDTLRSQTVDPISTKPKVTNLSQVIDTGFYPLELREQGIEGEVWVDVWINNDGKLVKYEIVKSTNDLLTAQVIAHMSLLEFEPAKNDLGQNIPSKTKLPFQFLLDIE